jgi:Sel1 repeat
MLRKLLFVVGVLGLASAGLGQGQPPDLVAIKAAAEAGDAKAQYEYGKAVPSTRTAERLDWFYRSARAGYGPAEEELGSYFLSGLVGDKQKNLANRRESVRWSSRAACHGFSSAQFRIAQFYQRGEVLPKDRVTAYIWMRIANANSTFGMLYKAYVDQLITEMTSAEIAEAEQKLQEFHPQAAAGLNSIDVDLFFAQVQLGSIYTVNGVHQAVVNNVRFSQGESKALNLAGDSVRVVCLSIEGSSVLLGIADTPYTRWVKR